MANGIVNHSGMPTILIARPSWRHRGSHMHLDFGASRPVRVSGKWSPFWASARPGDAAVAVNVDVIRRQFNRDRSLRGHADPTLWLCCLIVNVQCLTLDGVCRRGIEGAPGPAEALLQRIGAAYMRVTPSRRSTAFSASTAPNFSTPSPRITAHAVASSAVVWNSACSGGA